MMNKAREIRQKRGFMKKSLTPLALILTLSQVVYPLGFTVPIYVNAENYLVPLTYSNPQNVGDSWALSVIAKGSNPIPGGESAYHIYDATLTEYLFLNVLVQMEVQLTPVAYTGTPPCSAFISIDTSILQGHVTAFGQSCGGVDVQNNAVYISP
jgi:hypothetical protein